MNDFLLDNFVEEEGGVRDPLLLEQAPDSSSVVPSPAFVPLDPPEKSVSFEEVEADFFVDQEDAKHRNALDFAGDIDPDKAKRIANLSRESGLPISLVEDDPDGVEKFLRNERAVEKMRTRPVLANRMKDPQFAQLAQDDVETLAFWENDVVFTADLNLGNPTFSDRFNASGLDLISGFIHTPKSALSIFQMMGNLFGGESFRTSIIGLTADNLQENFFQKSLDIIEESKPESIRKRLKNDNFLPNFDQIFSSGIKLIPQLPQFLAFGLGGRAAATAAGASAKTAARVGGATAGVLGSTPQVYDETLREARRVASELTNEDGTPQFTEEEIEDLAQKAAFFSVTLNLFPSALFSAFGLETAFLAKGNVIKRVVKGALGDAVPEGFQEFGEELSKEAGVKFAVDPEREIFSEENLKQYSQAFLIGLSLGGTTGGSFAVFNEIDSAVQGDKSKKILDDIAINAQESKLAERSPEDYADFANKATNKNGPVDAFIELEKITAVAEEKGMEPAELFQEIGIEDQAGNLDPSGLVKIPVGDYAAKVAKNPELHEALSPHVKFNPNDMTPAEAEHFKLNQQDQLKEEAQRITIENQENQEFTESAEKVKARMRAELIATDRVRPEVATANATLYQSFIVTTANRVGMLPHELDELLGPRVTGVPLLDQQFTLNQKNEEINLLQAQVEQLKKDKTLGIIQNNSEKIKTLEEKIQRLQSGEKDTRTSLLSQVVELPEFKKFFEGSKVVDDKGDPLVVFHGTNQNIKGEFNTPAFFTNDPNFANAFTDDGAAEGGQNILPVFLNIKNPEVIDGTIEGRHFEWDAEDVAAFKAQGKDGVIVKHPDGDIFTPFEPSQIKSVFNQGTFDSENPNILFQGDIEETAAQRADRLLNMEPVVITESGIKTAETAKEARTLALEAYKKLKIAQTEDSREVKFPIKSFNRVKDHSAQRIVLEVIPSLNDIVEHGVPLWTDPPLKEKDKNIIAFHYYGTKIKLPDGKEAIIRSVVREDSNNNFFHDLQSTAIEFIPLKKEDPNRITLNSSKTNRVDTKGASTDKLLLWLESVKGENRLEQTSGQKGENNPRGSFQFTDNITENQSIINLLEGANLSTAMHEFAHFYFETYRHFASQEESPTVIKEDMHTLLEFVGVKDIETWNTMTNEERRAGHEQVARSFEAYLFEGKAPSAELKSMFRRFREWLIHVYKSIRRLNVTLTDDVRQVFDRMLASDEQIEKQKQIRNMRALFPDQESVDVDDKRWDDYMQTVQAADDLAKEKYNTKVLKDLQWFTNAKNRELKKLQREHREKRNGVKEEAINTIGQLPVYQARAFLRQSVKKVEKTKSDRNKVTPSVDSLFDAIGKLGGLNPDELVDQWGLDKKEKIKSRPGQPVLRAKEKGLSIDRMAELLAQDGYLELDIDGKPNLQDFEERFMDELFGVKRYSTANERYESSEEMEAQALAFYEEHDLKVLPTTGKLDRRALEEMYGTGDEALWRQLKTGRYGYIAEDGVNPDVIAKEFRFTSADELVQALIEAPSFRDAVTEETNSRMLDLFGDIGSPEAQERAVNEALTNEAHGRMVHTELSFLTKRTGSKNLLKSAAKQIAEERIAETAVRDINPNQFIAAEKRARRDTEKALRRGDNDTAVKHKRTEILNHHFAKAAFEALERVKKAVNFIKGFEKSSIRKNIDVDYIVQIDKLMERHDFRKSITAKALKDERETLEAFIEKVKEEEGASPAIDQELLNERLSIHFRDMSFERLMGLRDAIKSIAHIGRNTRRLFLDEKKRSVEKAGEEITEALKKNKKKKSNLEEPRLPGVFLGAKNLLNRFYAVSRKMGNEIQSWDGFKEGGNAAEILLRPLDERMNWETKEKAKGNKRLAKLFSVYSFKDFATGMYAPSKMYFDGVKESYSKMARIMMALNWGNVKNRERLMMGQKSEAFPEGWNRFQVQEMLDTLDQRDWNFVQSIWDYFEEFWPEIKAKEERVNGVAEKKVKASQFQTKFGMMRGGYFPITFESLKDGKSFSQKMEEVAKDVMVGAFARQHTKRGHAKARIEWDVRRPLRLDFGVIFEHLNNVIHDLAYHEWSRDIRKITKQENVDKAIREHAGQPISANLQQMITDVTAGELPAIQVQDQIINYLRNGVTIAYLAWNFGTAVLQPLGLTQSMVRIGPKWVAKGMAKWLTGAANMEGTVKWIHEQSDFMSERSKTQARNINEIRNKVLTSPVGLAMTPVKETYFYFIVKAQMIADIPTWLGAYEKAMTDPNNDDSKAIWLADRAVKDAQSSGLTGDLAGIERGAPTFKIFTNFFSFFSSTFNLTADVTQRTQLNPYSVGRTAVDMFFLLSLPVILEFYLRDAFLKGECDGGADLECVVDKIGAGHGSYLLSTMVGVREFSGSFEGFGYQGPTGTRFFNEASGLIKQVSQREMDEALAKAASGTAGILFHLPTGQLEKTFEGFMAIQEGKTDNPTALLFGEPKE